MKEHRHPHPHKRSAPAQGRRQAGDQPPRFCVAARGLGIGLSPAGGARFEL